MIKLIGKLIVATIVGIVFALVEIVCAIPCGLRDYYKDCIVPAFKDIFDDYRNEK